MSGEPLTGIMKICDLDSVRAFRIACDCTNTDHDVDAWIEVEGDSIGNSHLISVTFTVQTETPWWDSSYSRIREAWKILLHGYSTRSHNLLLNVDAARNFSNAITSTIDEFQNRRNKE